MIKTKRELKYKIYELKRPLSNYKYKNEIKIKIIRTKKIISN